jgi:type II secretory pathway pseudopilin PulG
MKKLIFITLSLIALLLLSSFSGKEKKEKENTDYFALIETQQYTFDAESITSARGGQRSLSDYSLTVDGDSAEAYLPYVGRAYSGSYGGDGPINFNAEVQEYKTELKVKKKEKNNQTLISFKVKGDKDTYTCTLSVGKSGYANLTIVSSNRQSISYNGRVVAIEEE